MERALVSLVSLFALLCAPFEAGAEHITCRDFLQIEKNSCKAPELSFIETYYNGALDREEETGDLNPFVIDTAVYEPASTEADLYDMDVPYELTELIFNFNGDYEWIKEYDYGEYEEEDYFEERPAYDIPVVINDKVERFIKYFQTKGKRFFAKWLEKSGWYLPMVKEILRERGLPEDLTYLALIESGFNPVARSRARAVGIWQFMRWTGGKYGLRVDWWIDERRDPEKATVAAASYLESLYGRFGSWYLAAAGFNGGEGRVISAIKKYKTEDFWELASHRRALKRETKDYVPKYLAAMIIAKDPESYGFYELNYFEPVTYDKVKVPQATDLKVLAKAAGTTVEEIKRLNPELKRWFTPPNYPDYELKIPKGSAELFKERIKTIPPPERLRFHTHRVKKGDTLSHIARKYRTAIRPIMYLNNLKSARFIRAGSTLVVPVREKKRFDKKTAKKRPALRKPLPARVSTEGLYTVKKGDTLWDISIKFGLDMDNMLQWNGLKESDLIHPGQKLYLKEARLNQDLKTSLQ